LQDPCVTDIDPATGDALRGLLHTLLGASALKAQDDVVRAHVFVHRHTCGVPRDVRSLELSWNSTDTADGPTDGKQHVSLVQRRSPVALGNGLCRLMNRGEVQAVVWEVRHSNVWDAIGLLRTRFQDAVGDGSPGRAKQLKLRYRPRFGNVAGG
jgi:hypothetical protein